jgi:Na+/melibiose symporter-like transporter
MQCFNLCLLSAILLGIIYLFFGAFPLVFGKNHGFQQYQVGLAFMGLFVGMLTGIATNSIWERAYNKLVKDLSEKTGQEGSSEPEFRLPPTIFGAILVPIGLFGTS